VRRELNHHILEFQTSKFITIVGDIGGNFKALVAIFEASGWPGPDHVYIFTGDYFTVKKTPFNILLCIFIVALKKSYPEDVHFILGNRDTMAMPKNKNQPPLFEVLKSVYSEEISTKFLDFLDSFPCAILLNETIYINNGAAPNQRQGILTLDMVRKLSRADAERQNNFHLIAPGLNYSWASDYVDVAKNIEFQEVNNLELTISSYTGQAQNFSGYILLHNLRSIVIDSSQGGYIEIPTLSDLGDYVISLVCCRKYTNYDRGGYTGGCCIS